MAKLGALVGEWSMTMSDAWFLEPPGTTVPGTTTIEWFGSRYLSYGLSSAGAGTCIPR
jgi:hypothetical protein